MSDLSGLDPARLAEAVAALSDEQLREAMTSEFRADVLEEVFRRFPDFVHRERTRDVRAAIEWVVAGPGPHEDRFVVLLERGSCRAGRDLEADPDLTLELDGVDFLRLVTGGGNPAALFVGGRLQARGDAELARGVPGFFRIPGRGDENPAVDPSRVDAQAMAATVARADDGALKEGMRGPFRQLVLDEIFRRFPEYLHTDKTTGMRATVKFKIRGRPNGDSDRYLVHIEDGDCRVERDADADARATISMDGADFLKLVTGNANPTTLFLRSRLRVHGDLMFAAQLAGLFRIPRPGE